MIGILNAYHFDPTAGNYQERYTDLMVRFTTACFPDQQVRNYNIALGEWPQSLNECEAWLITGSSKGAYDDEKWIRDLQSFILQIHNARKKMIGICFGHQLIAHALGGLVQKSDRGWGVGVRTYEVTFEKPWMDPKKQKISLLFSHQDQVVRLPLEAELLGGDQFCPYQMMQIGDHILTMQGHPEFSVEFARDRLISRKALVPQDVFDTAMQSFSQQKDDQLLGQWIHRFVSDAKA